MKIHNHPTTSSFRWPRSLKTFGLAIAAALTGASGFAQTLSFEPFTGYTEGVQLTANIPGPTVAGYSGNWTNVDFGSAHPVTIAGSLNYGGAGYAAGVADHIGIASYVGGIGAGNSGRMFRLLDNTLKVSSTTAGVRYLSFLYQSGQEAGATIYQMLDLYNGNTADANRAFTAGLTQNGGNTGSEYDFGVTEAYTSTLVAADAGVHLFVVKFDLSATANSDSVTVWIDPTLGAGEPAGGITVSGKNIVFDRLAISNYSGGNSGAWDEIRWGTTFDSVTIVAPPAPTVYAPVLGAAPRYAPVGQTIPLTVTISTNANATSTVQLTLTNDNASVITLPGGNPTTLTFTAGATNVQVINVSVVGAGEANLSVVTNATFSAATIQLGALVPPSSYESFSGYAEGVQLTANVPAPAVNGYTGDWTTIDFGNLHPDTRAGSLAYGGAGYAAGVSGHIGLPSYTGGIGAGNSGRMYRLLAGTSLVVTSNTVGTRYLSFLYQSGQEAGATIYQMLDLYNGNTADANRTFAAGLTQNGGNTGSEYDFGVNEAYSSTGVAADTAVHLFVVKFELSASDFSDSVTVWIDPTLGAGEPAGGITVSGQNIAFDRLSISSYSGGNSAAWDEIRWSTNFDGVTIVAPPAPTTFAPTLSATLRLAPIGQTLPIMITIPTNANAISTVKLILTNNNPGAVSLVGGSLVTNTFAVGATNVQFINTTVSGTGAATISVVTNETFSSASLQLGSQISASESFQYNTTANTTFPLDAGYGYTGGTGFGGEWGSTLPLNQNVTVVSGLNYPGLITSSNAANAIGSPASLGFVEARALRPLDKTYGGVGGGTVWASCVIQGTTPFAPNENFGGYSLFGGGNEQMFLGLTAYEANNGTYGFKRSGAQLYQSFPDSVAPSADPALLVYRFDFPTTNGGPVAVTFYANPVLGATPPATPTGTADVSLFTFDAIRIACDNNMSFDELRLGASWLAVTPFIANPSITQTSPTQVQISWSTNAVGTYTLLSSSPSVLGPWNPAGLSVSTSGGNYVATDTISGSAKFYRLQKQ